MRHVMVVGTSEPQDFQLLNNDVPFAGAGWDVAIVFRGPAPVTAPTAAWLSESAGTVRVSGCQSMPTGKYAFRFRVTDGHVVAFVPSAEAGEWKVVQV